MESQSSSSSDADQLQGSPLQDQAVRLGTVVMSMHPALCHVGLNKVVVRFPNEIIRGFADKAQWSGNSEAATVDAPINIPSIRFCREESSVIEMLSIAEAKAVFFVNSFEGNQSQSDIRFHDGEALMEKIWIRVTFADSEVLEGMIDNTLDHVRESGFYLYPTDPAGNNYLVYVLKKQIADFKVLGLRNEATAPTI